MALIFDNLQKLSSTLNSELPKMWGYTDLNTTLETMSALGYFNGFIGLTELEDQDLIYVLGSDGASLFKYILVIGNTELVNPVTIDVQPFIYRYVLQETFIPTGVVDPTPPGTSWIFIPRGGFVVSISAILTSGVRSDFMNFTFNYLGSQVGSKITFLFGQTQGTRFFQPLILPVDDSITTDPAGFNLNWEPYSHDPQVPMQYDFQIEILQFST